jgi:uncharacterized protein (TIGR02452 family)
MSLARTAQETLDVIARGGYTAPSGKAVALGVHLEAAQQRTVVYRPAELEALLAALAPSAASVAQIEVTTETTAQAGRRLVQNEHVTRVVALNFASAKNPGGGFLGGAKAQEEDLARCSGLYACLREQSVYYDANRRSPSLLYTDHIIYSPDVPFFRDDRLRFLEDPFLLSIITAPAPNAGAALSRDPTLAAPIRQVLDTRAQKVIAVAAAQRHRCVILGAWGCGVFRNDADHVAAAFAQALSDERLRGAFDRLVFAIHDPGGRNLRAFERRFGAARLL